MVSNCDGGSELRHSNQNDKKVVAGYFVLPEVPMDEFSFKASITTGKFYYMNLEPTL